ncbi:ABC transporter substrate-binding protein [Paenibacillus methanolicus]|uniref:MarR-like DNA-binding transcriptional regulator SgrR of sgrS sRNA n=1 Tax=Paenibacillus methanolicus TaxID=582686 RepID=A0A5S5CK56_9BACL|nr:ABC transporter substrate-binding protein [Paenibacillus methanolicus]TYP79115.1 MarR-like DNA-binding transcriptional regulator SgrR of sgrS sRNA [Paenibacillus methanolicus]
MVLEERYVQLYESRTRDHAIGEDYDITLDELAELWTCSRRNVKLIIRRMEEEGLIRWQAGLGRGHRSRIAFRTELESYLLDLAIKRASGGAYKAAIELLERYGRHTGANRKFMEWLSGRFGFQQEDGGPVGMDMLRLPIYRSVITLDPAEAFYVFDSHLIRQLFDRLVRFDIDSNQIVPGIAHDWKSEQDGKVWTFYLRKGVRFHHGRELTSDDVAFSIERQRASRPDNWLFRSLLEVVPIGPLVVRFQLRGPNFMLPRLLCATSMSIVPKELVSQQPEFWRLPVGSGPFRLSVWAEDRIVLEAHPAFFEGRPHLDLVELILLPDDAPISDRSRNWGQLLMDHELVEKPPESGWVLKEKLWKGCTVLAWNMRKDGPHRHPTFRKAVDHVLDRSGMLRLTAVQRGVPASGFRVPETGEDVIDDHDPALAVELLSEAGYAGEPITLVTYSIHERDAEWIRDRCAEAGIPVRIRLESWRSIRRKEAIADEDCLLYGVGLGDGEADVIEVYEQPDGFIPAYMEPDLKAWVGEQVDLVLSKRDEQERARVLGGIERRMREEAHLLFLLHKKLTTYIHPAVKGVRFNSLGWIDFNRVWIDSTEAVT